MPDVEKAWIYTARLNGTEVADSGVPFLKILQDSKQFFVRQLLQCGLSMALVFAASARAEDKPAAKKVTESEFVTEAARSGMAEVAINKMAQEKTKDGYIKKFAAMLVKDHTMANEKLMAIAKESDLPLPKALLPEYEKGAKHLEAETTNFDMEYTKHLVERHLKSVELFTAASKDLKNEKLRGFAEMTLPTLKEHWSEAKKLADKHGSKK